MSEKRPHPEEEDGGAAADAPAAPAAKAAKQATSWEDYIAWTKTEETRLNKKYLYLKGVEVPARYENKEEEYINKLTVEQIRDKVKAAFVPAEVLDRMEELQGEMSWVGETDKRAQELLEEIDTHGKLLVPPEDQRDQNGFSMTNTSHSLVYFAIIEREINDANQVFKAPDRKREFFARAMALIFVSDGFDSWRLDNEDPDAASDLMKEIGKVVKKAMKLDNETAGIDDESRDALNKKFRAINKEWKQQTDDEGRLW